MSFIYCFDVVDGVWGKRLKLSNIIFKTTTNIKQP